jgi:hypothetical protein
VAIGGPWQERGKTRFINSPERCRELSHAFADVGVQPYIWGYPWMGMEEQFAEEMAACAVDFMLSLMDPELGSNPQRAGRGAGKTKANEHAWLVVEHMHRVGFDVCGLSTYGSGVRMRWFPLYAFARALAKYFPERTFLGGQTYTEDARVDPSITDFLRAINDVADLNTIQLVPNFGSYKFVKGSDGQRRAKSKTANELDLHFMEFVDEAEPVDALIGWADNFMTPALWESFSRMAARMERGVCAL